MRSTTMNEMTNETTNENFRELTADEMADLQGATIVEYGPLITGVVALIASIYK